MSNINTKQKLSAIIAGIIVTVTNSTFVYQLSALAANSSVRITRRITCEDIIALRNNSKGFVIYFDPPHNTRNGRKPGHFDINATLDQTQRRNLRRNYQKTFSKFKFDTPEVQNNPNRLKFEVGNYGKDLAAYIPKYKPKKMISISNICANNCVEYQDPSLTPTCPPSSVSPPPFRNNHNEL